MPLENFNEKAKKKNARSMITKKSTNGFARSLLYSDNPKEAADKLTDLIDNNHKIGDFKTSDDVMKEFMLSPVQAVNVLRYVSADKIKRWRIPSHGLDALRLVGEGKYDLYFIVKGGDVFDFLHRMGVYLNSDNVKTSKSPFETARDRALKDINDKYGKEIYKNLEFTAQDAADAAKKIRHIPTGNAIRILMNLPDEAGAILNAGRNFNPKKTAAYKNKLIDDKVNEILSMNSDYAVSELITIDVESNRKTPAFTVPELLDRMYEIDFKRAVKIENKFQDVLAELKQKTVVSFAGCTRTESKAYCADSISNVVDSLAKDILEVLNDKGIKVKTPKAGYNKLGDGNVLFSIEFVSRGEFVSGLFVLNYGKIFKYPDYYTGKDAVISINQLPEFFEEKIKESKYNSEHTAQINGRLRRLYEGKSHGRYISDDYYRNVNYAAEKIVNVLGDDFALTLPPKVANIFSERGVVNFGLDLWVEDKYVTESFAVTKEHNILHPGGKKVNLDKIPDLFKKKLEKIECRSAGHVSHSAVSIKAREVKLKKEDTGFIQRNISAEVNALARDIVKALTEKGIDVEKPKRGYRDMGGGTILFGLEFISGSEFVSEWFVIKGINNVFFPWPEYYLKPGIKGILIGDMPDFFREKISKKSSVNSMNSENNNFTIAGMVQSSMLSGNPGKIAIETGT